MASEGPVSKHERRRVRSLREGVFDLIGEESAYWVGFLMADGNVHGNRISLNLAARDSGHVEAFRDFLGSDHRIAIRVDGACSSCRFSINSRRLATALARFGVAPRKSLTACAKEVANDRHFWRGVVDGDGSVFVDRGTPKIVLASGSRALLGQYGGYVKGMTGIDAPRISKNNTIWRVRLCGAGAHRVIRLLYDDCAVALPRKHKVAAEVIASGYSPNNDWSHLTAEVLDEAFRRHGGGYGAWTKVAAEFGVTKAQLKGRLNTLRDAGKSARNA